MKTRSLSLRQASPEGQDLLLRVHQSNREEENKSNQRRVQALDIVLVV